MDQKEKKCKTESKEKTINIAGLIQNVQKKKTKKKLYKIQKKVSLFSKEFHKFLKVTTLLTKKNFESMKQKGHTFKEPLILKKLCAFYNIYGYASLNKILTFYNFINSKDKILQRMQKKHLFLCYFFDFFEKKDLLKNQRNKKKKL